MPQNPPWRHHFIPEFYLKRWTSNGKVVEFSKPYGNIVKPMSRSPRATGFVDATEILRDLPIEEKAFYEEKFFSPVDNRAATVMQKMNQGDADISRPDRVHWAQFMMTLLFRHPYDVMKLREVFQANLFVTTPESERRWRKQRKPTEPRTLSEAMRLEAEANPRDISRRSIKLANDMMSSEKVGTGICLMAWGSTKMGPFTPALLTSDRPIHWFGALQDENCHILMPIGPKRLFWAANSLNLASEICRLDQNKLVEFVNDQTVRRATDYVYAMSDTHLAYVQERMGLDPEITIAERFLRVVPAEEIFQEKKAVRRQNRRQEGLVNASRALAVRSGRR